MAPTDHLLPHSWHLSLLLTDLLQKLELLAALSDQRARFTAASIAIITADTGETRASKVGNEISDVINAPSYTCHSEWW